jgi:hypothetical protein
MSTSGSTVSKILQIKLVVDTLATIHRYPATAEQRDNQAFDQRF